MLGKRKWETCCVKWKNEREWKQGENKLQIFLSFVEFTLEYFGVESGAIYRIETIDKRRKTSGKTEKFIQESLLLKSRSF